jgi:Flp pilus assembly protein TadD
MGDASVMAGRPDEALRLERFAIDLDPQSIGNYFRYSAMAAASFEKNDLEGAFQWAQRSIALKPDYVVTHAITAASLALSGDLHGARRAVIGARRFLPGISLESASELSLFRKEWSEPFQSGLAAAGMPV